MGKTFKRRWNRQRIQRLKALRKPTDDIMIAGTEAAETVKEIIEVLSAPEKPTTVATEVTDTAEAVTTTAVKKPRRRRKKTTTISTTTAE
mgnify:CR=1 FL=1|tara:strand:+ start:1678 stop:1947 length:270 start_codon:yes stop_codon:yes gene_type:complete